MRVELTEMSKKNVGFLMEQKKTPRQIVEFLKEEAMVRSFGQVLRQVYEQTDLQKKLTEELIKITGEDQESIGRKVRNWLKDANMPKNREILFQICFALKTEEKEASKILAMASENTIHYRNPKELSYAYALRMGKSYEEAKKLSQCAECVIKQEEAKKKMPEESFLYTRQLEEEFSEIAGEEELMEFFKKHAQDFGTLHKTAHTEFCRMFQKLQQPESSLWEKEEKYSIEEVVQEYLRMNVPSTKKSGDFSTLQKVIKKYWPNNRSILNILNKKEDVSRKALLLLYLITEESEEEEWEETEESEDIRLEERVVKMNLLLDKCGMAYLDPCCPFDYLLLYAMKAEEEEFPSDRMSEVLGILFEETGRTEEKEKKDR